MYDEPKTGMDELSKRDLMAMAALQGLLAGPGMVKASEIARYAYQLADDMIAQSWVVWDGKTIAERMAAMTEAEHGEG
jgi:hypothetical protein